MNLYFAVKRNSTDSMPLTSAALARSFLTTQTSFYTRFNMEILLSWEVTVFLTMYLIQKLLSVCLLVKLNHWKQQHVLQIKLFYYHKILNMIVHLHKEQGRQVRSILGVRRTILQLLYLKWILTFNEIIFNYSKVIYRSLSFEIKCWIA